MRSTWHIAVNIFSLLSLIALSFLTNIFSKEGVQGLLPISKLALPKASADTYSQSSYYQQSGYYAQGGYYGQGSYYAQGTYGFEGGQGGCETGLQGGGGNECC